MSNANYNKQTAAGYGSGTGSAPKLRKGHKGAEHDAAHKDTKTSWPKAPGQRSPSLNRAAKFPIVKSAVNSDGVDV